MDNVFSTGYFNLGGGTRPSDPSSAYLFIYCSEVLSDKGIIDVSMRGFKLDKTGIKLTSFADDVGNRCSSIKRTLKIMKTFCTLASLKINVERCEACWLGKSEGNTTQTNQSTVNGFRLKQRQLKFLVLTLITTKSLKKKRTFIISQWTASSFYRSKDGSH